MLIDASHPEETRVAIVSGQYLEDFDVEVESRRQLRGNIYLAKVTRVEPSLQAAFIDFGGNRHGFLAFSEIHPDYYQIPVADREALLAFYDFPAEHWDHLRTSNPIESVFATVRHRTVRTKGALSQKTARLMVYKLVQAAAKGWRRLKGANQLPMVIEGVKFTDGVLDAKNRAA